MKALRFGDDGLISGTVDKYLNREESNCLLFRVEEEWAELRIVERVNKPAVAFWEKVISEYTDRASQSSLRTDRRYRHGQPLHVHRFRAPNSTGHTA